MKYLLISVIVILAIVLAVVLIRYALIRRSLKEINENFAEKLHEDTNTQITISSRDPEVIRLAEELNEELSELRQERLVLHNSNTELQGAVTNIAHDLRTPLTAISGYLDLLEQEVLEEKPAEYVAVIRERTENLKSLTEELFKYTVINTTSDDLKPESLSLNHELEMALAAAYEPLVARNITPEISITDKQVIRTLDANALQRILGNILNNAAKYSAGDLTVILDESGTITFSNYAPDLTEVDVGKLFDRFYTVENAKGSTGLGLSIARLLTEKMGGRIRAEYLEGRLVLILEFPENNN